MAVTSAGTVYTPTTFTNSTGDQSVWAVADHLLSTTFRKPVLLFCHGNGSPYNHFTVGSQYKRLRDRLIDAGWVYIEALGHSASNWGREFAIESYVASAMEVAQVHPLGTVVCYGRSMGGTSASSLALKPEWGLKQHVTGLLLESAVQSLEYRHITMGKSLNGQYPEGRSSEGGNYAAFMEASEPFDPMRFSTSLYEDMAVQFIHGTADDNVWPQGHVYPQYARIKDHALYSNMYLRGLGTHGTGETKDDEIFNPTWKFLRQAQGLYPEYVTFTDGYDDLSLQATYYRPGWRVARPLS